MGNFRSALQLHLGDGTRRTSSTDVAAQAMMAHTAGSGSRPSSTWACAALVQGPDGADGFFLAETVRCRPAGLVHVVPPFSARGSGQTTQTGHLHVALRVVIADPMPGVAQPLVAIILRLLRKPSDLVPAPDP